MGRDNECDICGENYNSFDFDMMHHVVITVDFDVTLFEGDVCSRCFNEGKEVLKDKFKDTLYGRGD